MGIASSIHTRCLFLVESRRSSCKQAYRRNIRGIIPFDQSNHAHKTCIQPSWPWVTFIHDRVTGEYRQHKMTWQVSNVTKITLRSSCISYKHMHPSLRFDLITSFKLALPMFQNIPASKSLQAAPHVQVFQLSPYISTSTANTTSTSSTRIWCIIND